MGSAGRRCVPRLTFWLADAYVPCGRLDEAQA
jgi:hypothetical protein